MDSIKFLNDKDRLDDFMCGQYSDSYEIKIVKDLYKKRDQLTKKQKMKLLKMIMRLTTNSYQFINVYPCNENIVGFGDVKSKNYYNMFHQVYKEMKISKSKCVDIEYLLEFEKLASYKTMYELYALRINESDKTEIEAMKDFETFIDTITDGYNFLEGFYGGVENTALIIPFLHNIYLYLKKNGVPATKDFKYI